VDFTEGRDNVQGCVDEEEGYDVVVTFMWWREGHEVALKYIECGRSAWEGVREAYGPEEGGVGTLVREPVRVGVEGVVVYLGCVFLGNEETKARDHIM